MVFPQVQLPPLRERVMDLPLLAQRFIPDVNISSSAQDALAQYTWPGNIAELRNVLTCAAALAGGAVISEAVTEDGATPLA
jgi:transcriptional regulator with GAF, ATPase, and Fis domain